ncbi:hypothetical protein BSL78_11130 [Paramuricea clavata]|uniref:Uncharacterized protein n=1 Tax=Paramuricea clavata TaxID=317549 RepID=A0A6S7JHK0_PARCT|nr:hypothetical protein BSL78_11130 [Paramuricea clavata]
MPLKPPKYDPRKGKARERHAINAAQRSEHSKALKCYVCNEDHKVIECPTLADSTVPERFNLVREARLCFSCLNKGHVTRDCRWKKKCEKNGCTRLHHQLLHEEPGTMSGISSVLDKGSILPVVRVCFRAPNGRTREGNVLIDSGAGTTVIRKDYARSLGLQGKREKIDLAVVGGERVEQPRSRKVTFSISALNGAEEHRIEDHEIEKTVLSVPRLDRPWLKSFAHLRDIDFSHKAGPIDLILGVQFSHLHAEDEVRQGRQFEPVGKRTKLGWFVIGSDSSQKTSKVCSLSFVQPVNLEKFYEFETLGIQAPQCHCPQIAMSPDDRRAIELIENSCKQQGGRYIIGLPWKKDKNLLPNNYSLAEKKLFSLERSLKRNDVKASLYNQVMNEYETNGWSRQLLQEEEEAKDKPSPDMASYIMIKIANENESQCPRAAVILKRDRYMDDLIHSKSTLEKAEKSKGEVYDVLATGSFKIREWFVSSSVQEMQAENVSSPEEENPDFKDNVIGENSECTTTKNVNLDGEEGIKTLGVTWNPQTDKFSFSVKEIKIETLTKRTLLSRISRLFDPLGLASVVTIKARVALQEIWKAKKYDWDDPLPEEILTLWYKLFRELESLNTITFPRCLRPDETCGPFELHVFADASATAYGAVAYLPGPPKKVPKLISSPRE